MWSHRKMAVCLFTFLSFLTTGTLTIVLLKMTSHLCTPSLEGSAIMFSDVNINFIFILLSSCSKQICKPKPPFLL